MPGFFSRSGSRKTRPPTRIEEVFYPAVLADPNVDADALTDLLRDPSPLMVDDPIDEVEPEPPPPERTIVRVAKIAALVTAVALLCGAIVAAAFLDRQRRSAPPPSVPDSSITGVRALAVIEGGGVTKVPKHAAQGPGGGRSQGATWRPTGAELTDPKKLVRQFYEHIGGQPDKALAVLGGTLTDDERRELAVAWRGVERVDVDELGVRPDGLVHAVVRMTTDTAEQYRLDHLLTVDPPKITEVRLLSAQRIPARSP